MGMFPTDDPARYVDVHHFSLVFAIWVCEHFNVGYVVATTNIPDPTVVYRADKRFPRQRDCELRIHETWIARLIYYTQQARDSKHGTAPYEPDELMELGERITRWGQRSRDSLETTWRLGGVRALITLDGVTKKMQRRFLGSFATLDGIEGY